MPPPECVNAGNGREKRKGTVPVPPEHTPAPMPDRADVAKRSLTNSNSETCPGMSPELGAGASVCVERPDVRTYGHGMRWASAQAAQPTTQTRDRSREESLHGA